MVAVRDRTDPMVGLLVLVIAFAAYVATLSPTVEGGDSGELIAAAYVGGVVHPPGYPLFTMLANLFTRIPLQSVAWRVNLLSALCDSVAAWLLFRAVRQATGDPWSAVFAAGMFAFSPLVWAYAVTAEVFALNNLFVAGLLALSALAAAGEPSARRVLPWACLWTGLGLGNHHTLVFVAVPVVAYIAVQARLWHMPARSTAIAIVAFAFGLLPYVYLPLAALRRPAVVWGDPTTLNGFLAHLLRQEYGTFRLASPDVGSATGGWLPRVLLLGRRLTATTFGLGPLLLMAAVAALARRDARRSLALAWSATLAAYVLVFSMLANVRLDVPLHVTVQERFWQQAMVLACALMGLGLAELRARAGPWLRRAAAVLALAAPAFLLAANFRGLDRSHSRFFRDYGLAILDSLPPDALLLITSDEAIGSVRYLQVVEGHRSDVHAVPTGQITSPWFRTWAAARLSGVTLPPATSATAEPFTALAFVDANAGRLPILLVNRVPWLATIEERYSPWPAGLADRVRARSDAPPLGSWLKEAEESFDRFDPRPAAASAEGSWERYVAENYWRQRERFGLAFTTAAAPRGNDPETPRLVVRALEPLAAGDPHPPPWVYKNLGVAYHALSRQDPAAAGPMVRYWTTFLGLAPADKDAAAIRSLIAEARPPR